MKIEVGKEYYTRDDLEVYSIIFCEELAPGKIWNQTMYCGVSLRTGVGQLFTESGTWFMSGMESELDLIRECNHGSVAKSKGSVERKKKVDPPKEGI